MSIATRFVSSTARPRLDLSGGVFYAPLWRPDLGGSTFQSIGDGGIPTHLCTVTGATYGIQGRTFDKVDDLISVPDAASINNLGPLTAMFWANPTSLGELDGGRFFQKSTATGDVAGGIRFHLEGTNQLRFRVEYVTTSLAVLTNINAFSLGVNTFFVLTWDGSITAANAHIYVNNVEATYDSQTDGDGARVTDANDNLIIGNTALGARTWEGLIGEGIFYNRVLSASERLQNYSTTRWRYN